MLASALAGCGGPERDQAAAGPLPALAIDPAGITVSGVSSGGYLAHHLHVAHSTLIAGAGIVAAGPYRCAGDGYPRNLRRALTVCMRLPEPFGFAGPPPVAESRRAAHAAAAAGRIDPLDGLAADRVLLFSGSRDRWVPMALVAAVGDFYAGWLEAGAIARVTEVPAAHAMVTAGFGNACDSFAAPYLNDCGFDLAGAILGHLYGPLAPPGAAAPAGLIAFDQRPFAPAGRRHGLADLGYAYVPAACAAGRRCRLHVALHGCLQAAASVGDAFVRHAGYNAWAEANAIVVLYPQAAAVTVHLGPLPLPWPNPAGCWDWWGFTGADYADRDGAQSAAIAAMIARLAAGGPPG